jgi:hypothetical protein
VVAVIRIDAVWLAVEPIDMRAGAERLLARVVQVFGAAHDDPNLAADADASAIRCAGARAALAAPGAAERHHASVRAASRGDGAGAPR